MALEYASQVPSLGRSWATSLLRFRHQEGLRRQHKGRHRTENGLEGARASR